LRAPAIEVVLEDGGDGGIGAGADLERPLASGLEALAAMAFGEPEDADAGAKALLGMAAFAHDDINESSGVGPDVSGLTADPLRGPGGVAAMRARHVFGERGVAAVGAAAQMTGDAFAGSEDLDGPVGHPCP
jgi:hypothetical protein